jgi:acetyl esterase/lipase
MNLRIIILVFTIAAFVSQIAAQENPKPTPTPTQPRPQRSMRDIVMMPVVYKIAEMDKVVVKSNLKYTHVDNPNLLMDVHSLPSLKARRRPAVIFIHGGAGAETTPKDWGIYTSWGRLAGASGFVGVTFTHRLTGRNTSLEDAERDLAAAINYVRANAEKLGVDKDRICLAAYSAGGVLLSSAMRDKPAYVRCLVNFYAAMDISQKESLFAANESAETLKKFSPINYLAADANRIAPMFIARAGLDAIPTINDSIDRFIREALSKNVSLTVANHPNGVHGFDNQTDDERSREIIQSAIAFMQTHLRVIN